MKAFPHADYMKTNEDVVTRIKYLEQGMDLRDYFAAKAMQAMLAHPNSRDDVAADVYAKGAYVMADAMIKQREENSL